MPKLYLVRERAEKRDADRRYAERLARLRQIVAEEHPVAALLKGECRLVLESLYGGRWRAIAALTVEALLFVWRWHISQPVLAWLCRKNLYHLPSFTGECLFCGPSRIDSDQDGDAS